jgi:hypothetical protein
MLPYPIILQLASRRVADPAQKYSSCKFVKINELQI